MPDVDFPKRVLVDRRRLHVGVPPERAFRPIERIGGENGWYHVDWLWDVRGGLDLLLGGVGTRRGRRHPERLVPGDALDFWRVEAVEPPRRLRLLAEMRMPGRAWLQFELEPDREGGCDIVQTSLFEPSGRAGRAYWTLLRPLHDYVFRGMLRGIARRAEAEPAAADRGKGSSA